MNAEAVMYTWLDELRFQCALWLLSWERRPLWLLAYKLMTVAELAAFLTSMAKKRRAVYEARGKAP